MMRLLDFSLPNDDIKKIKDIIENYGNNIKVKENSIKARQTGPSIDIDLILQFPQETSICECHKVCDEVEKKIQSIYSNSSISIHTEPICYKKNCQNNCSVSN